MKSNVKIFVAILAGLVLLNVCSHFFSARIDLTSEGRYTLSGVTRSYADSLCSPLEATLYLNGELNSGFRRLRRQTIETLQEVGYDTRYGLRISNVDPAELTKEVGQKLQQELNRAGLSGVPVFETKEDGQKTRSIVYPFVRLSVGGKYTWINLLDNTPGLSGEENLNRSMESLEYKIADAMCRLSRTEVPKIAFLEGHGELDEYDVMSATESLSEHFNVDRGEIGSDPNILDPYRVVIIAKPSQPLPEKDKYALDQYLMHGGRLLWLVDAVGMTTDTLRNSPNTIGLLTDHNIADQLFVYGIRLRPNIVEDLNCGMIAVSVPSKDGHTQLVPMPWTYSPLLSTNMNNEITRNVGPVRTDFCGTIDTVGEGLQIVRTPLLRTSAKSKLTSAPIMASLATIHQQPNPNEYNKSHQTIAIAEEGIFRSAFVHRSAPQGVRTVKKTKEESVSTKMIVVADGDVIRNTVRFRTSSNPTVVPLGYDEMSRQTYGNSNFIVNAVQWLADDSGLMALRNRTFALRLLDRQKISEGTTLYKALALLIPLIVIAVFGVGVYCVRRSRFAHK